MCAKHYARKRKCGDPLSPVCETAQRTDASERAVADVLRRQGKTVVRSSYNAPFDLLVDGIRVDVKRSNCKNANQRRFWKFILAKNGKLREEGTDYYVFCLSDVPGEEGDVYMMFKSPIGAKTKTISSLQLEGDLAVREALLEFASFMADAAAK